jgi:hypothetical protein
MHVHVTVRCLKDFLTKRNRRSKRKCLLQASGISGLHGDADPLAEELSGALVAVGRVYPIAEVGEEGECGWTNASQRFYGHGLNNKVAGEVFILGILLFFCAGGNHRARRGSTAAVGSGESVDAGEVPNQALTAAPREEGEAIRTSIICQAQTMWFQSRGNISTGQGTVDHIIGPAVAGKPAL